MNFSASIWSKRTSKSAPMYLCGGSPDFFLFPYLDYWSDPLQRSEFGIREFWDTLYNKCSKNDGQVVVVFFLLIVSRYALNNLSDN
jgi:hypothetical protein